MSIFPSALTLDSVPISEASDWTRKCTAHRHIGCLSGFLCIKEESELWRGLQIPKTTQPEGSRANSNLDPSTTYQL